MIRKFLVLADAPAGCDEDLACRSAIFENVKGYGFGQEVAEPLVQAVESLVACRDVISRIEGEVDRTLIAHIDAWAGNWHDLAFHVLSDLSESTSRIRRGDTVIDYRNVSEDDLKAYWLSLSTRRIPEDWFDVMFFIGRQWRFRGIRLDQIENGIFRENRRTARRNAGHLDATPESGTTTTPQPRSNSTNNKGMSVEAAIREGERHLERNPWPGLRALAKLVGCSPSTMSNAVKVSVALTKGKNDALNQSKSVNAQQWSDAVGASVASTDPLPDLDDDFAGDDILARLKSACRSDDDRAALDAMPPEKLQKLAGIALTDPDTGKPLKSRKRR